MTGTAALIARIIMRYLALPVLLWVGIGPSQAGQIVQDPDILELVIVIFGLVAVAIEGWTFMARKKGGKT